MFKDKAIYDVSIRNISVIEKSLVKKKAFFFLTCTLKERGKKCSWNLPLTMKDPILREVLAHSKINVSEQLFPANTLEKMKSDIYRAVPW